MCERVQVVVARALFAGLGSCLVSWFDFGGGQWVPSKFRRELLVLVDCTFWDVWKFYVHAQWMSHDASHILLKCMLANYCRFHCR